MNKNTGIIITLAAGIFWGFSGTCGQYIFDNFHIDATYLTSIRLLCGGVILCAIGFFREREKMTNIWKSRPSALLMIFFSLVGIMFCQLSYMKAISYTNSGTATILQYLGSALMIVSCFLSRRLPSLREAIAVVLAILGIFFIATHGNLENMVINPLGLSWGLWSAVALAVYTMLPRPLIEKFGSIVVMGYGMLIGGIVMIFTGISLCFSTAASGILTVGIGCIFMAIGLAGLVFVVWIVASLFPRFLRWFTDWCHRLLSKERKDGKNEKKNFQRSF